MANVQQPDDCRAVAMLLLMHLTVMIENWQNIETSCAHWSALAKYMSLHKKEKGPQFHRPWWNRPQNFKRPVWDIGDTSCQISCRSMKSRWSKP